jgi:nitroreductase
MEFERTVRSRHMVRSFSKRGVDSSIIDSCVDLASRSPSAGKTQGWHLVLLENADTEKFWKHTFPAERREGFRWPHLFDAPAIAIACTDPHAYLERYSEDDKARTGLGESVDKWPTPYWTVDASFAVMTFLLALHDADVGALFFAVFNGEESLRQELDIPDHMQIIGAIAMGYPYESNGHSHDDHEEKGASASRDRHSVDDIIHRGKW